MCDGDNQADNYEVVLKKFDEHFVPKVTIIHKRVTFQTQKQQDGETVETYARRLYMNFQNLKIKKNIFCKH